MPKMKILNAPEQKSFEMPPVFNSVERKRYFTLPLTLQGSVDELKTATHKVCFLVMAGYFKARHQFFARQFHFNDLEFVAKQIGVNVNEVKLESYSRMTYMRHKALIINYFGLTPFDKTTKLFVQKELTTIAKVQFRPKWIFWEIIHVLTQKKIVIPNYYGLSQLIVNAVNHQKRALSTIIKEHMVEPQKEKLDVLLEKVAGEGNEDKWRYQLTLLKKASQSLTPGNIKENVTDLNNLMALYEEFSPIIIHLAMSDECVRYYSVSVIKSQVHQIFRRSEHDRYLHLIAFIVYQSVKLQDILIDTFLLSVKASKNATEKEHKNCYYDEKEERERSVTNLVDNLEKDILGTIATIKLILVNPLLTAEQKVAEIDLTVNAKKEKKLIEKKIDDFKKKLTAIQKGKAYYDVLEKQSVKLQNRVADIVRYTKFDESTNKANLIKAIQHYQKKVGDVDKNAPVAFLTPEERASMFDKDGKFRVSLYKALLYIHIFDNIKSGALNVVHSEKYRSLNDYLIPKADWNANREEYLQRAELTKYADCKNTLASLAKELETRYKETNDHFIAGENPWLKFKSNGQFHVATPKLEDNDALPLNNFFPERKYIPLLEALSTVDVATEFLEELEHWQIKHTKEKPAKKLFFAGIMARGSDTESRKFAQISKGINENELENTLNWYFTVPNIRAANDRLLQFMNTLEALNIYLDESGLLHTSDDGQKCGVSVDSLNANYSFKYLGKDKGSSVITFIDMRQMMWYSDVVSSAEREAAYVIDGLMHNDVIKSDIHSTDTHGYSEVIFAVLYLLGFIFAPRIKGLGRQKLYAFVNQKIAEKAKQEGFKHHKYINEARIEAEWDEILRFVATIKLKVTTASQLFRRLNSYSKQHPLYKTLKEFGKIIKTLFILKYTDDVEFRQAIEKQLNKVENSNKLSKAISLGNDHAFLEGEKEEQNIAESCRRLIKNTVMCWNGLYISKKIENEKDEINKKEIVKSIKHGSLMHHGHFNFGGEFDFSDEKMSDSVGLKAPKNKLIKGG